MRIIVTGGAGFIGSALCRYLVAGTKCHVLNIDKLTYAGDLRSLASISDNPFYEFLQASVSDLDGLVCAFERFEPDAVVHLAAETHVDRSITSAADFIQTNAVGTYMLLEAARSYWEALPGARKQAFRFLHVSTDEVYGSLGDERMFGEDSPYDPSSPYSASKAAADHFVLAWHRTYGLPAIISNCSNNFGPYQFPEKLIPLSILNAIEGLPLPIYGDGSHVRDWLYVGDHVRALHLVLTRGHVGEKYNIGARNERSNLRLINELCTILDELQPAGCPHARLITLVPDRPGHDRRYAIDPTKVETDIGWRPQETLTGALERTAAWYLANRQWWEPLRQRVYGGERLGLLMPSLSAPETQLA